MTFFLDISYTTCGLIVLPFDLKRAVGNRRFFFFFFLSYSFLLKQYLQNKDLVKSERINLH